VPAALARLFRGVFGEPPTSVVRLPGGASPRRIHRLTGAPGRTAIGVLGPDRAENRAFRAFTAAFRGLGLPVPEVLAEDEAAGAALLEDLGDVTLRRALERARRETGEALPAATRDLYARVVEWLPRFQVLGGRAVDFSVAHPRAAFDRRAVAWDLAYFKYQFLHLAHVPFHEDRLEDDFERLAALLLQEDGRHFQYRDMQSRNVMIRDGEPWFLDYQGGLRGPPAYDVAKLLWESGTELPDDAREDLLGRYLEALAEHVPVDAEAFRRTFPAFVLMRILQGLGAYGYRGLFEGNTLMRTSIPPALKNARALFDAGLPVALPEVERALRRAADDPRLQPLAPRGPLTVRIASFSYRRGIPRDLSEHGGGFVFDCRGVENPGRVEAFAALTGRDEPVRRFLERAPGSAELLDAAFGLVHRQVRGYLARGFTWLGVQFGCTGGRHRSVYFAERVAERLRAAEPGIHVVVVHEEAPGWTP
jgi:aminoglycoside/choline kinase family phosphotransferase